MVDVVLPEKAQALFRPGRYKVLFGGRGSGKSHSCARALLIKGTEKKMRFLCARQQQQSIKESVHKLLSDMIAMMELEGFYEIQRDAIIGINGTTFVFEGIYRNVTKIKSMEGIDICWVEEAEKVTDESWKILIPTIRKDGSEIWVSFNPELEEDPTYKRFIKKTPKDCVLIEMNWRDNPFFPLELKKEMEELRDSDYQEYLHVYEGQCYKNVSGAVYGGELVDARAEGRICRVPYERGVPVDAFFDLGWADSTTIWLGQKVGFQYRVLEYIEDSQAAIGHYLKILQDKQYVYGTYWLPHDAKAKQLGSGRSVEEIVRATGARVRIVPKLSVADGINAARTIFPNVWFDEDLCEDGLHALGHYRYEINQKNGAPSREPVHDWASHGADAFRYMAVALRGPKKAKTEVQEVVEFFEERQRKTARLLVGTTNGSATSTGWMKS